jgi:nucleoside-triphosphatase THEP1
MFSDSGYKGPEIILITGSVNSGKSRLMEQLAIDEKKKGNPVSGIIARSVFEHGYKKGFDVINVSTGRSRPLAGIDKTPDELFTAGKYSFSRDGFNFAREALLGFHKGGAAFLDEVGPLELEGGGYADCLIALLGSDIARLYIVVRTSCLPALIEDYLEKLNYRIIKTDKQAESAC